MLPKRYNRTSTHSAFTDSERHLILAAETLRNTDPATPVGAAKAPEEKISIFWRVFGGTLLSICALVTLTAYQSLATNIHEVRGDVGRLREGSGEYIKKDEFNTRTNTMWTSIRENQALSASVTVLTSRLTALEQQISASERERKDMQVLLSQAVGLKDRFGSLDEMRKQSEQDHKDLISLTTAIATLRERDSVLEKLLKDAEVERKEISRETLVLRERLAKLEGLQEGKPTDKRGPEKAEPAAKPATR